MKYIYCVVIPLLLQMIAVYTVMAMNTGNGSWVGLGVFLFAIPLLPATTIANAVRVKSKTETTLSILFMQSMLIAFLAPVIVVALYVVLIMLEGLF